MNTNKKWTAEQIPDLTGKVVIVTGANSGIGFVAAEELAAHGAETIMACRSLDKGQKAIEEIRAKYPQAKTVLMHLDLADLDSVRQFAQSFLDKYDRLDILVNNAGVMALPQRYETPQGFEMQFGTNHLGHFALTGLLVDRLLRTPGSRVVTVSSYVHHMGWINFGNLNSEKSYQKWLAYGQSKLANVLFGYELQRKFSEGPGKSISVVVHPGYASTNLQDTTWLFRMMNPIMAQSQEMGALPTLYAAACPEVRGGEYIGPDGFLGQRGYPKKAKSSGRSFDEETAKRLWEISEELTGVKYPI